MKKFIIIAIILLFAVSSIVVYLNQVIIPQKLKAFLVTSLKEQTGKDVTLKSLEFSIFKGFILHDLVISDSQNVILSTRLATCSVFIWPIFKKQIIIPGISLKSPYIFLERRADNTFNLQDLFISPKLADKKAGYNISVFKISVLAGNIVFQDDTLAVKFKKEIKDIQFNLYLSLPASLRFNFKGRMSSEPAVLINANGHYSILGQGLVSNITVKNLSTQDFKAYYSDLGDLVSGLVNLEAQINLKNKLLGVNIKAKGDNLVLAKDKLEAKLNSSLQVKFNYDLENKKLAFNGECDIAKADITGVQLLGQISNLSGKFIFNDRSLVADSLKAQLWGMPFEIKLGIKDFKTPVLSINTNLDLKFLPAVAKEKYNFSLIKSAAGAAALSVKAHPDEKGAWVVQGDLGITGASLKLDKQDSTVEDIAAAIEFSPQGFSWKDTKFKYQGINYESSGSLTDFGAPAIKLKLFSRDLSLGTDFDLLGKKIKVRQLSGKYFGSQFSVNGDIDATDTANLKVDLGGKINFELGNLNKMLGEKYPLIKPARLVGQLDAQFNLDGNLSDFKNCYLKARLTSSNFSLYGLNTQSLSLDFLLDQKIAKIAALNIGLYDGSIRGFGTLNLDTPNLPYQLELSFDGIKLEKLKLDTASKNKNISGTLLGEAKLNGLGNNLDKLSGGGSFFVKEGRLWELNLLQGVGKILFAKDLGSIELSECSSEFSIKDKFISTDKLQIKGNVANLYGPLKIGFDGSLEGELNVDILSDMVPVSGTFKDIATAIIGQSGKFGVIKLSGTLSEPKYHFKPAVTNIIKGLTDVIFGKQQ